MPNLAPGELYTPSMRLKLVCKIEVVPASHPFHGGIEVSIAHLREFLPDKFHELPNAHAFARVGHAQLTQVPIRIDIEIPPLDHVEVRRADQLAEGFVFFDAIGHARENKIIDGCPAAEASDDAQAFDDVIEGIVVRTVIGCIYGGPRRVEAYA